MKLAQMFKSKFLQAEDLDPKQNTVVTIDKVYPSAARDRGNGEEPEVKWNLRLREFRKPMGLWKPTARMIAEVLGTDETDQWVGKRIAIYPSTYLSYGETKPCINVDKWLPEQVQGGGGKPAAASLVIAGDTRPIPKPAMERFLGHVKGQGKTWDDFLRWCKLSAPDALPLAWGVELDAIPAGVLPAMKAFLDSITPAASPATGPAAARELVDASTGEVMTPSAAARPTAPVGVGRVPVTNAVVPDDDIPF